MKKTLTANETSEVMQVHKHFLLNSEEWTSLIEEMNEPSEPNEALKRAAIDYESSFEKS